MCPVPVQHLLSLPARRGGTGPPARGVPACRAPNSFQGNLYPGEQPPGAANPQHPCQELQLGQRRGQGQAPWDSISSGTGRGPVAQPRCKKLCPAREPGPLGDREGLEAELSFPLVAAGAAPCLCGQRLAKSGAGALPKMVKARGAGLAAAQPDRAR